MQIIKDLSESIECALDMAADDMKKAILSKDEYPVASRAFYNESTVLMDSIKLKHDAVVALIEGYKKEKGEPPAPMMAIYNYTHEKHINKAAAVKALQDLYSK